MKAAKTTALPYQSGINSERRKSMTRNIHSNYFEDTYCKHECQGCKRCFIVGEVLSVNMNLACPYCGCRDIILTAASTEESAEDMDMGCLGIYFSRYDDGKLMLYTEREFASAMRRSLESGGGNGIPLGSVHEIIIDYCMQRDGQGAD